MAHSSLRLWLLAAAAAVPAVAHANTGIGMGPFLPMSIALVPALVVVIPLEAGILRFALPVRFLRALWLAVVANLLSTVLGAMIGFALDFALAISLRHATGLAILALGVVSMYAITVWIEYLVMWRRLPEVPRRAVLRASLIANAVSYVLLVGWTYVVFVATDSTPHRSRMTEVVNVGGVAKMVAGEHFQATGRFRASRQEKPTVHTRRVTTSEAGRITVEIDYPRLDELNGKTLVWEPEIREGKIVAWHCIVPEAPLKYFPAACRNRTAAGAAGAGGKPQ